MAQTPEGRVKMKATIRAKYGLTEDGKSALHVRVGSLGGSAEYSKPKGFAVDNRSWFERVVLRKPKTASAAGKVGGSISKRRPKGVR